ncbi:MAG: glycosyltransferase family 2 protein [Bacteroidota bacterium]
MHNISISVIIPCFNVENYIAENLDSVLGQDLLPLEIICVDDGSIDNTISIIESYREKHPGMITLLKNDVNKGAPFSRNRGMEHSSGEYLQFLDADDIIFKNKFSHQQEIIAASPLHPDILVGSFTKKFLNGTEKEYINEQVDKWVALIDNRIGVTSANLFKKSKVEEVGGWTEFLKSSQEYDLMFRMMQKNATVLFDTVKVNFNRERPSGSITKSDPREKWKRYINLRVRIYEHLLGLKELSSDREDAFLLNMLIAVRILYRYDKEEAVQYYKRYMKGKGLPADGPYINKFYRLIYVTFGFDIAQRVTLLIKGRKVNET